MKQFFVSAAKIVVNVILSIAISMPFSYYLALIIMNAFGIYGPPPFHENYVYEGIKLIAIFLVFIVLFPLSIYLNIVFYKRINYGNRKNVT